MHIMLKVNFIKILKDQYQEHYSLDFNRRYFESLKFAKLRNALISFVFSFTVKSSKVSFKFHYESL